MTFFPLLGVLAILFLKPEQKSALRWTALVTSLATFVLSLWVFFFSGLYDPASGGLQLVARYDWIRVAGWDIRYYLAADGLSILLILLTTFLTPLAILSTWTAVEERVKDFMLFFLLLEVGMTGVFVAQDLFLFYIFWEFTLVPMYFLIGIWGGPNRLYAAVKFFLYTMAGSILMLLAILWLGIHGGTFSVPELAAQGSIPADVQTSSSSWRLRRPLPSKFRCGRCTPGCPMPTVEAPTAGSVILAGVLLKMGTYGFLQLQPAALSAGGCAICAAHRLAGSDRHSLRRSGLLRAKGRQETGGLFFGQPSRFRHAWPVCAERAESGGRHPANGQSRPGTGALFLLVGMIYEQTHTREIQVYGGLWKITPSLER